MTARRTGARRACVSDETPRLRHFISEGDYLPSRRAFPSQSKGRRMKTSDELRHIATMAECLRLSRGDTDWDPEEREVVQRAREMLASVPRIRHYCDGPGCSIIPFGRCPGHRTPVPG